MCIDELKQEGCSILYVQRPRKHDCQTSDLCELQKNFIRRAAVCSTEDKGCSVDEGRPERTELQTCSTLCLG